jgi:hypothetical protein
MKTEGAGHFNGRDSLGQGWLKVPVISKNHSQLVKQKKAHFR